MDGIRWIKLQTDIFENDKMIAIENMPEGDTMLVIWLKLIALAGKCNMDGMIYIASEVPYTEQLLSQVFHRPLNIIQLALRTFVHFHMIEIIDDVICVSNWAKYQNIDGMEKVREQNRIRASRYRERQKMLEAGENNVTVTHGVTQNNGTEEDKEKEKEEDIILSTKQKDEQKTEEKPQVEEEEPKKKRNVYRTIDDVPTKYLKVLDKHGISGALREAYLYFIFMRIKTNNANFTEHALDLTINKANKFYPDDVEKQIACINQSIEHGWLTLYELKNNNNGQRKNWANHNDVDDNPWSGVEHL